MENGIIESKEEFVAFVAECMNSGEFKKPMSYAIGKVDLGIVNPDDVLQATYPVVNVGENFGTLFAILATLKEMGYPLEEVTSGSDYTIILDADVVVGTLNKLNPYIQEAHGAAHENLQVLLVAIEIMNDPEYDAEKNRFRYIVNVINEDAAPSNVETIYHKLHMLSYGKAKLRSLNLDGAFGKLKNLAWIGNIPVELELLRADAIKLKMNGQYPNVDYVDKFPRYLQHVVPADNTRILDTAKVRFGSQLHPGTVVMPGASYINFNAGTEGTVMVEGRISSSVVVGKGSDIGGGASILGTLSGGNSTPITIGENCLLGANSVCGISLGNDCIIDAGIAVLAGTRILANEDVMEILTKANDKIGYFITEGSDGVIVKGADLSGLNGIHYRIDSVTGMTIAFKSSRVIELNEDLH